MQSGWSPIDFEAEDLDGIRLEAGGTARVSGKLAGVRVGFDVEVHAAIDVRYGLAPAADGSDVSASVSLRRAVA